MSLTFPKRDFWLLVTGSRSILDSAFVMDRLAAMVHRKTSARVTLVHGACPTGVDAIADMWGRELGMPCERFPAPWDTMGKKAGMLRNRDMVDFIRPKRQRGCVALWDGTSRGTRHCFEAAIQAGIPTAVYVVSLDAAGLVTGWKVENHNR